MLGLVMCGCLNFCYISKLCYDGELKLIKFNFIYVFIYFEIICYKIFVCFVSLFV